VAREAQSVGLKRQVFAHLCWVGQSVLSKENIIHRLWTRWISIGTAGNDRQTQKRIMVTNTLAFLASVLTIPYLVLYAVYDFDALFIPLLTLSPQVFLAALTPFLHRFGRDFGSWYLVIMWISFAMLYNYYFGVESGLQYLLLPGATGAILVFGVNNVKAAMLSMTMGFIGFVVVTTFFLTPAAFIHVDQTFLSFMYTISLPTSFVFIFGIVYFANLQAKIADDRLQREFQRSEALLYNVLPESIASELKEKPGQTIAKYHDAVSILFADIVEFTPKASRLSAEQVVELLNVLFSDFDDLTRKHGLEKVKTIGDAFMAAGGMPVAQPDHAERVGRLALDMITSVERFSGISGEKILLRIGINSGPAVAGVIGNHKLVYDVWGDTVNTAGRMETYCVPQRIQVTRAFHDLTKDVFTFEHRGVIDVKGKGDIDVWFLTGLQSDAQTIPAMIERSTSTPLPLADEVCTKTG